MPRKVEQQEDKTRVCIYKAHTISSCDANSDHGSSGNKNAAAAAAASPMSPTPLSVVSTQEQKCFPMDISTIAQGWNSVNIRGGGGVLGLTSQISRLSPPSVKTSRRLFCDSGRTLLAASGL